MERESITPVAEALITAYADAASYSIEFTDSHGSPPTRMATIHHFYSVAGLRLGESERFELGADYVEFGRVQFTDFELDKAFLLRSEVSMSIDRAVSSPALFDASRFITSDVTMLVFSFSKTGLTLGAAGTRHESHRSRLVASGTPSHLGFWPFDGSSDDTTFDQHQVDRFTELGGLGAEGAGGTP